MTPSTYSEKEQITGLYKPTHLVFVKGPWAFFYEGDDWMSFMAEGWGRSDYAKNAAIPSGPGIIRIAFDAEGLYTPDEMALFHADRPCAFSASDINRFSIAWLQPNDGTLGVIPPGTSLGIFHQIIRSRGGRIYEVV